MEVNCDTVVKVKDKDIVLAGSQIDTTKLIAIGEYQVWVGRG